MKIILPSFLLIIFYCCISNVISAPFTQNNCFKDTLPQTDSFSGIIDYFNCDLNNLPSIMFTKDSFTLNTAMKDSLKLISVQLKNYATCRITVVGYITGNNADTQINFKRIAEILKFLTQEENIRETRILFRHSNEIPLNRFNIEAF